MARLGNDLRDFGQCSFTVVDGLFDVPLAGGDDAEGDPGFGCPHGCALGAVEVGTGPDHFLGKVTGHLVFGQLPVTVHGVEVELGRVDHEVVVNVLRVGHRVQQPPSAVEGDLGLRRSPIRAQALASWAASCTATPWCGAVSVPARAAAMTPW